MTIFCMAIVHTVFVRVPNFYIYSHEDIMRSYVLGFKCLGMATTTDYVIFCHLFANLVVNHTRND